MTKHCMIRLDDRLHIALKVRAYQQGTTIQNWLTDLIIKELKTENNDIKNINN